MQNNRHPDLEWVETTVVNGNSVNDAIIAMNGTQWYLKTGNLSIF